MYIPCASVLLEFLPFLDGILPLRATCTFYLEKWMEYKEHKYNHDFQLVYPSRSMIRMNVCMFCDRQIHCSSYSVRFGSFPRGGFVYCSDCFYPFVLNYKNFLEQCNKQLVMNTILPTPCNIPRSDGSVTEGWVMSGYTCADKGVVCAWWNQGQYFEKVVHLKKMESQLLARPIYMKYL